MFNQCPKCYNETVVVYEMGGKLVCPTCFFEERWITVNGRKVLIKDGNPQWSNVGKNEGSVNPRVNLISKETGFDTNKSEHIFKSLSDYSSEGKYRDLRLAQRNPNSASPEDVKTVNLIEEYIDKAPSVKGRIFRGVNSKLSKKDFRKVKVGSIIDFDGFSSWTSDLTVAEERFARQNKGSAIFITDNVTKSADVSIYSRYSKESEVLVSKGTRFKVIKNTTNPSGIAIIRVEEIK